MALTNLTKVGTLGIGSNIEVVGVVTTGQFKSGTSNLHSTGVELTNLNVSGIATIGGNLSIGGTLTYQDVTNIDSVGLITARAGMNVSGGQLDVGSNIKLGNAGVITATSFVGSGANLTSLPAQATIANNADNRVITGGSSVNLNGEANLTYDGLDLVLNGTGDKAIRWATGGANKWSIYHNNSAGALIAYDNANSAERLRITSAGKLLVGTTTEGSSGVDNLILYRNGNGGITIRNNANQNGNLYFSRGTSGTDEYKGYIQYQHAQDVMVFGTGHTERVRITADGKFAIGNASPQQLLHVWPDTANTTSAYVRVTAGDRNSNTGIDIGHDASGNGQVNVVSNGTLTLSTNNSPRIKIASNAAATSIGGSNVFNAMLTVQGDISGQLLNLKATEGTTRLMVSGTDGNGCEMNLYDAAGAQRGIMGVSSSECFVTAPASGTALNLKGYSEVRTQNYHTNGSAGYLERWKVYQHGTSLQPSRHGDSVETKSGGRYYVLSGATPLDGSNTSATDTPLMRCGHSYNGVMYLWMAFNGDQFHRGCRQMIIDCQGTYGYVSNSTRKTHNQNALGAGLNSLNFGYQNSGSPNYHFKVNGTWAGGQSDIPYILWTWVGHNSAYPYAL